MIPTAIQLGRNITVINTCDKFEGNWSKGVSVDCKQVVYKDISIHQEPYLQSYQSDFHGYQTWLRHYGYKHLGRIGQWDLSEIGDNQFTFYIQSRTKPKQLRWQSNLAKT